MKKQTLSFIGILLIITFLVTGCELLGLGGPKADATDGEIWYYPSDKPDGVRVAHAQLGI